MKPTLDLKQIEQSLAENEAFLQAIQHFQSVGKVAEVNEFQKRLQISLLTLVDELAIQFKSDQMKAVARQKSKLTTNPVQARDPAKDKSNKVDISKAEHELNKDNFGSKSKAKRVRTSFTDMPKI